MNYAELVNLVPPLRGCALCVHSVKCAPELHCGSPTVRDLARFKPVRIMRQVGEACGPSGEYMEMASWRAS